MIGRLVVDLEPYVALGGVTRRGHPPESRAAYRARVDAWLDAVLLSWAHHVVAAALGVPTDETAVNDLAWARRQYVLHCVRELAQAA